MIAVTIFLVCFVVLVGVVLYLSKTIEHGEARFDADGKVIKDTARHGPGQTTTKQTGPARPAQRLDKDETPKISGNKDDE